MTKKKKRWILLGILGIVIAGGTLVAARSKDKSECQIEDWTRTVSERRNVCSPFWQTAVIMCLTPGF